MGVCGVVSATLSDGTVLSYFVVNPFDRLRRDRVCTLTFDDDTTATVPIVVIKGAQDLPSAP
jgi:hypothetical protein